MPPLKSLAAVIAVFICAALSACTRYEPAALDADYNNSAVSEDSTIAISLSETDADGNPVNDGTEGENGGETASGEDAVDAENAAAEEPEDTRTPVRVKGIYLASKPLGNESFMSELWDNLDNTELNAVVIDIKDDYGKITYDMQGVPELQREDGNYIETVTDDMPGILQKFREHDIYTIARVVTMRDPHIEHVHPEWCLTNADGSIYHDNSDYAWINPYKTEYWDFLVDIGKQAAKDGFNEIQFDYIRFCTDRGADDCVYDEAEVQGRDKISIITELVEYLTEQLKPEGIFVSCDVFGTIIRSQVDSRSVGQSYSQMAEYVDYICPMIYPSHYASGNFGLDAPDTQPYEAILGALGRSKSELAMAKAESDVPQATVRPWLQSFTATWLGSGNYITYDAEAVRQEIQAVYDAGYDEWILWSASVNYFYEGFLTPDEADAEDIRIEESRAALPEEDLNAAGEAETFPVELQEALDGDELKPEDEAALLEDGPIVTYG